jgi:pimeloyl-ACP methyl ester carboxylesterase
VKILSVLSFLLLCTFFPQAQSITGSWRGTLALGAQKLKIVFHIKTDSVSAYRSSFDSPDQAAFGIPCSETSVKKDSLEIQIHIINGGYRGKWNGKDSISGYYFQNGRNFPAGLSRTADTAAVHIRPQTPELPFPYNSEDLEYDGITSGIHYSGTLTYPKSGGPFPAAVLITGSGQQDRDETIFGHKLFAVIADYLTKRGYAVLRVDDRGIGKSTGNISEATSRDFAKDVETSLQELQKRKDIDRKRTGLIGHSEGALIASIAASESTGIDFIIMLAGPGLKGSALLELQNEAAARSQGASAEMAESYKRLSAAVIQAALSSHDTAVQMQEVWKSFLSWKKTVRPEAVTNMGMGNDTRSRNFLRAQLERLNTPWMHYFLQTDPADYISKLHCKVLALNGAKDIQVVPDQNLAGIDSALRQSAVKIYTTEKIPGLNHLFQHCKTCTIAEYAQLEESFAPEVLQIMGDWLDKNVK